VKKDFNGKVHAVSLTTSFCNFSKLNSFSSVCLSDYSMRSIIPKNIITSFKFCIAISILMRILFCLSNQIHNNKYFSANVKFIHTYLSSHLKLSFISAITHCITKVPCKEWLNPSRQLPIWVLFSLVSFDLYT